jgi:hypothetical protein
MLLYILFMGVLLILRAELSLVAWLRNKFSEGQQGRQYKKLEENKNWVKKYFLSEFPRDCM